MPKPPKGTTAEAPPPQQPVAKADPKKKQREDQAQGKPAERLRAAVAALKEAIAGHPEGERDVTLAYGLVKEVLDAFEPFASAKLGGAGEGAGDGGMGGEVARLSVLDLKVIFQAVQLAIIDNQSALGRTTPAPNPSVPGSKG